MVLAQKAPPPRWRLAAAGSRRAGGSRPRSWVFTPHGSPPAPQTLPKHQPCSSLPSSSSAANMSSPQSAAPPPPPPHALLGSKVSELVHVCVGSGMAPPEFSYSTQQVRRSAPRASWGPDGLLLRQPDVSPGSHHLSGEAVQRAGGPRSAESLRD